MGRSEGTKTEGVRVDAVLLPATPGRATQTLCSVLSFVLLSMTVKSPRALPWKRHREPALRLPAASRVLRNGRMYVDQKRRGAQK